MTMRKVIRKDTQQVNGLD